MSGVITGKEHDSNRGRVTINRDGSILLENVTITDMKIKNCDIHGQSGEYHGHNAPVIARFPGKTYPENEEAGVQ